MLHKLSEGAKQVINFAKQIALFDFGETSVGPDHLLLGITKVKVGNVVRILRAFHIDPEQLKEDLSIMKQGPSSLKVYLTDVPLSEAADRVLNYAEEEAISMNSQVVGVEHILLGILRDRQSLAAELLMSYGMSPMRLRSYILRGFPENEEFPLMPGILEEFSVDLVDLARKGRMDPLIGREREVEMLVNVLARRKKNNPLLIGEAGVGKTAIVEGLAQRMSRGEVPAFLKNKNIIMLSISDVVAGTKYRGEFEERMRDILEEVRERKDVILFIDEIHTIVGAGAAEGAIDAASILKPFLASGKVRMIGTTTPSDYRATIEQDPALDRRFQKIFITPPSQEEVLNILKGLRWKYEEHHGVRYTQEALKSMVKLSSLYITYRQFPDKAVDLLDEAGARVALQGRRVVRKADVEKLVSQKTGIPLPSLKESEGDRVSRLKERMEKEIIGQGHAIEALVSAIKRASVGVRRGKRPWGVFLFVGPTGVGKTHTARVLARHLMGSEEKLIRIDMSEFREEHTISRLIGAPPGYVGYGQGGYLTERVRNNPYSVVLLDEVEKAHPSIFNLFLQVLEDGRLTDGMGRTTDFTNTIIIMTSNIGTREMLSARKVGFASLSRSERERLVKESVSGFFSPEFLNRLDEVIFFKPLDRDDLKKIAQSIVEQVNRDARPMGWELKLSPSALELLVGRALEEWKFGARPLRRIIEREIIDRAAELLLKKTGKWIIIEVNEKQGEFIVKSRTDSPSSPSPVGGQDKKDRDRRA